MFITFINPASASGAGPMREYKIKIFSGIYTQEGFLPTEIQEEKKDIF